MKTEQILLWLIVVVVGVLGWQTYRHMARTAKVPLVAPTALATPEAAAVATRPAQEPRPVFAEAAPLQVEYAAESPRDPFASLLPQEVGPEAARTETPVVLPELQLQGLVYGQLKPRAIIDGQVVGEGDRIKDIEVLQIQRDGVLLFYHNRRFFLRSGSGVRQ